jgi:L-ascorbate metabolism protein UlaG (beta-lactamase superfamily)
MSVARILYLGGPTAVFEIGPWWLITDPTFDPPGRWYFFGWGTASRKLHGPAVAFSELAPIDAVLLSHDHHQDNLDRAGRELLPQMGTIVTTQAGARRLGGSARGLAQWSTTVLEADGRRLFADGIEASLRLVDSIATSTGVLIADYERARG